MVHCKVPHQVWLHIVNIDWNFLSFLDKWQSIPLIRMLVMPNERKPLVIRRKLGSKMTNMVILAWQASILKQRKFCFTEISSEFVKLISDFTFHLWNLSMIYFIKFLFNRSLCFLIIILLWLNNDIFIIQSSLRLGKIVEQMRLYLIHSRL